VTSPYSENAFTKAGYTQAQNIVDLFQLSAGGSESSRSQSSFVIGDAIVTMEEISEEGRLGADRERRVSYFGIFRRGYSNLA
jgi:hypothetical protein